MLGIDETNNLISLAKEGDDKAKETLLQENSPLIKSVIKKYLNKGIEFDDLYQLGSLGFLKAITNFDEVNSHFSSDNIMGNDKSFKDGETENFYNVIEAFDYGEFEIIKYDTLKEFNDLMRELGIR